MLPFGNANKLIYSYAEASRSSWFRKNQVLPTALPPVVALTETRVLLEQHWPTIAVQTFAEPAHVNPVLLHPPSQLRLMLLLAGTMRVGLTTGGKHVIYNSVPGTVKLTTPHHLPYEMQWVPRSPEPIRTAHVYLPTNLLARTAEAAGLNPARIELTEGVGIDDPLLYQLGQALAREVESARAQGDLYAETAAQMLAAQLLRHHCVFAHQLPDLRGKLPPARLQRVRDYVQAHLGEAIRLEELAALVHLSPYHFCRVFKRTTGLSPTQFVIRQRLARATELLQHTSLTVGEVAAAVGYGSPTHFAQLLLRYTGRLPTDYRKERSA